MESERLEYRIRQLQRKTVSLTALCGVLFLVLAGVTISTRVNGVKAAEDSKVLRVKGLIIEDDAGRARILLGAPLPSVSERIRKDATGTDLVFLDEQGYDRFRVGEMLPAMPGFHRIGSSYGVTILDTKSGERGGLGFLSNGKNVNRAVIALDRAGDGSVAADAWGAIVDDTTGLAGTAVMYAPQGGQDQEGIMIGTMGNKAFITFKDRNDKDRSTLALTDGTPSFELFDQAGKPQRDVLNQPSAAASPVR